MTTIPADTRALLLTGGLGSGKTAVAIEIGELLEQAGVPFAVVDLDWLCWAWSPTLADDGVHALLCDNLRAVVPNLAERGIRCLVLARAVLSPEGMSALRDATAPLPVHVVRLRADDEEVVRRLRARDTGPRLDGHLTRRATFEQWVAAAAPDADVVDTTGRDAVGVAADIVERLGWTRDQ